MYILPLLLSNLLQGNLDKSPNLFNFPASPTEPVLDFDHEEKVLDLYKEKNLLNFDQHFINMTIDDNIFKIILNVQQYSPEEITVKVVNCQLVIEGKHEDKQDGNVVLVRQFIRRFILPNYADVDQATSTISSDGILTITVPLTKNEKVINIERIEQTDQHSQDGASETIVSSNSQNSQTAASETAGSLKSQHS